MASPWTPVGPADPNPDPTNIISTPDGYDVYPTGLTAHPILGTNPVANGYMTDDSRNIQWAVSNVQAGGTVRLRSKTSTANVTNPDAPAAFEFPTSAAAVSFNIRVGYPFYGNGSSSGCSITGDVGPDGKPLTVIHGGVAVFNLTTTNPVPQTIVVKNIVFRDPYTHVAGSQPPHIGTTIIDNCVVDNLQHFDAMRYTWTIGFWSWQRTGQFSVTNCSVEIPDEAPPWTPASSASSPGRSIAGISAPYNGPLPRTAEVNILNNTVKVNATIYQYPYPTRADSLHAIAVAANEGITNIIGNTLVCRPYGLSLRNVKNANITNNTIVFPQAISPAVSSLPAGVIPDYADNGAIVLTQGCANNTFTGNTAAGFNAIAPATITAQVWISQDSSANKFLSNNIFGSTSLHGVVCEGNANSLVENSFGESLDDSVPCVWVSGNDNVFTNNDFTGTGLKGFVCQVSTGQWIHAGDILFDTGTTGNAATVYAGNFTPGDKCAEIVDLTFDPSTGTGNNNVSHADFACSPQKARQLAAALLLSRKYLDLKTAIQRRHGAVAAPAIP